MTNQRKHIQVRGVVQGRGVSSVRVQAGPVFGADRLCLQLILRGNDRNRRRGSLRSKSFSQTLKDDPPQLAEITQITVSEMEIQGGVGFSILGSREEAANLRWSLPTRARAMPAGAILETRPTGATDIRSPIAPIAVHATPSCATSHMTARPPRCRLSPCAPNARRNTTIPRTGASMPSRMPAPLADLVVAGEERGGEGAAATPERRARHAGELLFQITIHCRSFARRARCCMRARSWR